MTPDDFADGLYSADEIRDIEELPPQPCQPTMNLLEPESRSILDWLRHVWRWWHHEQPWPHA